MKIFLGMATSNVPINKVSSYDKDMNELLMLLRNGNKNLEVFSGLGHPAQINRDQYIKEDNQTVFNWYKDLICKSDVFIADITFPSTGLGIELYIASSFKKPIYIIINTTISKHENLSRMVDGIPNLISVFEYKKIQDLKQNMIVDNLSKLLF